MEPDVPLHQRQGTVGAAVRFTGRGLHYGRSSEVEVQPAGPGEGIVFHVTSRGGAETTIPARWDMIQPMLLSTCLARNGQKVRTVEHLMAALYACGIDNAHVRVTGKEIPLLDGSAAPFVDRITSAGRKPFPAARRQFRVTKAIHVASGNSWARLRPAPRLVLDVVGGLGGFPARRWKGHMNRRIFTREIAPARTYGHLTRGIQAKLFTRFLPDPLCLGANLNNAVVVFRGRVLSPGGLRFPDEFVRHRVLDLMGDLMLAGGDIVGHLTCRRPTHELNRRLLQALLCEADCSQTAIENSDLSSARQMK